MNNDKKNLGGAITFGILSATDYYTTKKIINTGGVELNPIVNFLIKKKCFGIIKFIITIAGMTLIYNDNEKNSSKLLNGIYGIVAINNINQIQKFKKSCQKK